MAGPTSSREALERLRAYLTQHALGPQERLEPERILAKLIGCSRVTLRSALDVLEREGRIWRHVGQGTFTGPRPSIEPIRPNVLAEMASPVDVLDARLLLEPAIASAAALAARAPDIRLLREHARKSSVAMDWQAYEQSDNTFHKEIARSTRNPLLISFLDVLSSVRGRVRWQRRHDLAFREARKHEYAAQQGRMHAAIIDAIAEGDADGARLAMFDHLTAVRAIMVRDETSEPASANAMGTAINEHLG